MSHPYFIEFNDQHEQITWVEADTLQGALQAVVTVWDETPGVHDAEIYYRGVFYCAIADPTLAQNMLDYPDTIKDMERKTAIQRLAEAARRVRPIGGGLRESNTQKVTDDEHSFGL